MSWYKNMYIRMFNQVSKTIEELQIAQQECEELCMNNEPKPPIQLADKAKQDVDAEED